jgi:ABC-2 type transporter
MTAIAFVLEKKLVTLDRIYAAGVAPIKIVIGHFLTHLTIVVVQTVLMLLVALGMFGVKIEGSVIGVFGSLLLLGAVGMSLGLLISGISKDETEAVQLALAMFFPALLLSGVMWPVEAVPIWLKWLSYALPTTWVAATVRSIMIRGWGIDHHQVYIGPLVSLAWMIMLLSVSMFFLRSTERQSSWMRRRSTSQARGVAPKTQRSQFWLGFGLACVFGIFAFCALPRVDSRKSFIRGAIGPAVVWTGAGLAAFLVFVAGVGGHFPSLLV